MWGRFISVLKGGIFLVCIPFKFFKEQIVQWKWSMQQCAAYLSTMTLSDVESAHGAGL